MANSNDPIKSFLSGSLEEMKAKSGALFGEGRVAAPKPPEQTPETPKKPTSVFNILLILMALIVGGIVLYAILSGGDGGGGSACPQIRGCGIVPPHCRCPADCPYTWLIVQNPPSMKGHIQCSNIPRR